jgi:hypothetical protein
MAERPLWKASDGELWWWRAELVKRYRHDAADQRCVLDAFQATSWTSCGENPLPNQHGVNRTRLRNTIKDLNRGQDPQRVRFHCNGSAGMRWNENI